MMNTQDKLAEARKEWKVVDKYGHASDGYENAVDAQHHADRCAHSVPSLAPFRIVYMREVTQDNSGEWVMVPREPTEWMLQAAEDAVDAAADCESTTDDLSAIAYKAMIAAAPQQAAEPVAWAHPAFEAGHPYADECLSATRHDGWMPLYTRPQPAQDAKEFRR